MVDTGKVGTIKVVEVGDHVGGSRQVSGLHFAHKTEVVLGLDSRKVARIACSKCNKPEYFVDFCPDAVERKLKIG